MREEVLQQYVPSVGVLDEEHGRLEHPRNAAAAHRRAPHHHVGGREVVQQPRRVCPVLGGHGDVHDAPRPVECLPMLLWQQAGKDSRLRFSISHWIGCIFMLTAVQSYSYSYIYTDVCLQFEYR